jgi:dephospho-CoA kinase
VVSCSESTQIERILQRYPSLSEPDAIKRIQSQLPLCEKVEKSDFVIDTDQPRENVESDAAKIFDLLSRR